MSAEIPFDDEQRSILARLVAATRAQPRQARDNFLMVSTFEGDSILHPQMGDENVAGQDIHVLLDAGLLSGQPTASGSLSFS